MKDLDNAIEGLAAVAFAVYLVMVIVRGNLKPFLAQVKQERGFVEFVLSIWILSLIVKIPETKPLVLPLVSMAGIILAMRIVAGADVSAFGDFANGRIGLFDLALRLFGNQA